MNRLAFACLVAVAVVLPAARTAALPSVGSDCTLGGVTVLARTPAIAGEVVAGIRKSDQRSIATLIETNQVLPIRGPVSARVVELEALSQTVKLRVLSGPSEGMEGWIADGFCAPK